MMKRLLPWLRRGCADDEGAAPRDKIQVHALPHTDARSHHKWLCLQSAAIIVTVKATLRMQGKRGERGGSKHLRPKGQNMWLTMHSMDDIPVGSVRNFVPVIGRWVVVIWLGGIE